MGYASAVGMMVMDELAYAQERVDEHLTGVRTDLGRVERHVEQGQAWLRDMVGWLNLTDDDVMNLRQLMVEQRTEVDQLRAEMDAILRLNAEMVGYILRLQTAQQYGRNNPIIMEDSDEEMDEGSILGLLVEIVDTAPVERRVVDDQGESPKL